MTPVYVVLIMLLILLPLMGALWYFGIATTRFRGGWFQAEISLPTRWEGKHEGGVGFIRRNFVIFKGYSALAVQTETYSGTLDVVVKGPDGSTLSPSSGVYGRDTSVLIDVSRFKRCSVTLRMDHFNGNFRIALQ